MIDELKSAYDALKLAEAEYERAKGALLSADAWLVDAEKAWKAARATYEALAARFNPHTGEIDPKAEG